MSRYWLGFYSVRVYSMVSTSAFQIPSVLFKKFYQVFSSIVPSLQLYYTYSMRIYQFFFAYLIRIFYIFWRVLKSINKNRPGFPCGFLTFQLKLYNRKNGQSGQVLNSFKIIIKILDIRINTCCNIIVRRG